MQVKHPLLIPGLMLALPHALTPTAHAAEGMWLPAQMPGLTEQLGKAGLELPATALADLQAAPMNAIVSLGGCSGSFVSPQGLVATNHHCVYGSVQYQSRADRNLLEDGFLARHTAEELPAAPGSRILVMEDMRDVTAEMLGDIPPSLTGVALLDRLDSRRSVLITTCERQAGRRCDVKAYFGGQSWILQTMLEIRDVRLVHAPAGAIGNYGGEVDNWMWPRHTGDYGFYRAYVGPDGQPAAYARDNVPYQPKSWLKIATTDLTDGDFVMIAGYPGVTERARTALEARFYYRDYYPLQQRLLADYSDLITRAAVNPADAMAYASIRRGADNYKKKILGQMAAAAKAGLLADKEAEAARLRQWSAQQPRDSGKARTTIERYEQLLAQSLAGARARLVNQTLDRAQYLKAARDLYRWAVEREKPDAERAPGFQDRDRQAMEDRLMLIDRRFVAAVDRAIFEQALAEVKALPPAQRNLELETAIHTIGMDRLYADTRLGSTDIRLGWLDQPATTFVASDDPFIRLAVAAHASSEKATRQQRERDGRLLKARIDWMALAQAWQRSEGRQPYADANGSLRITYGHIKGRALADGVAWTPFTTTRGLLEKESGQPPFASPPALLAAIRAQSPADGEDGKAADKWTGFASAALGTLPVNFLSSTDITNGNSGSAVLNARGEFVGLAFDGTLEGMLSDWAYDDRTTRAIAVDWRYMLWVMTRIDKADNLLTEMGVTSPLKD